MILYGTHLVEEGTQSSTIKSYFSAIKHILKCDGYEWDDSKAMLNTVTCSCRVINDRVHIRLPISKKLLDLMLYELQKILDKQLYLLLMYKALFMLAYYGLMRVGELTTGDHPIKAKDVHIGKTKDKILLWLHTSKTHGKESKAQEIKIEALQSSKHTVVVFCPFKIVTSYFMVRGGYDLVQEPFFVFQDKTPVAPNHARAILRHMLTALNLDPDLYGMHSTRSGRALDMYKMGYTVTEIKKAGCWKSSAVYRYLKDF